MGNRIQQIPVRIYYLYNNRMSGDRFIGQEDFERFELEPAIEIVTGMAIAAGAYSQ